MRTAGFRGFLDLSAEIEFQRYKIYLLSFYYLGSSCPCVAVHQCPLAASASMSQHALYTQQDLDHSFAIHSSESVSLTPLLYTNRHSSSLL